MLVIMQKEEVYFGNKEISIEQLIKRLDDARDE